MQVGVTCTCVDGRLGSLCHLSAGGCHLDRFGDCCPAERDLALDGLCCSEDAALDADGFCCSRDVLDGCGVCGGRGVFIDALGACCPVETTDANGACCFGTVDVCGVCLCSMQTAAAAFATVDSKKKEVVVL